MQFFLFLFATWWFSVLMMFPVSSLVNGILPLFSLLFLKNLLDHVIQIYMTLSVMSQANQKHLLQIHTKQKKTASQSIQPTK